MPLPPQLLGTTHLVYPHPKRKSLGVEWGRVVGDVGRWLKLVPGSPAALL